MKIVDVVDPTMSNCTKAIQKLIRPTCADSSVGGGFGDTALPHTGDTPAGRIEKPDGCATRGLWSLMPNLQ
jgi:hypothetical protein